MPSTKAKSSPPPLTEAEKSLLLIKKLEEVSKELVKQGPKFLGQVEALKALYDEELIITKILDPLDVAADLKGLVIKPDEILETIVASNETLKELWLGETYGDLSEDQALSKLIAEFTEVNKVLKSKSFKTFLRPPDREAKG